MAKSLLDFRAHDLSQRWGNRAHNQKIIFDKAFSISLVLRIPLASLEHVEENLGSRLRSAVEEMSLGAYPGC